MVNQLFDIILYIFNSQLIGFQSRVTLKRSKKLEIDDVHVLVVAAQSGGARVTDQVKLEAEVSSLRRQLHQAKRDSAAAPSKTDTLSRLMVSGDILVYVFVLTSLIVK